MSPLDVDRSASTSWSKGGSYFPSTCLTNAHIAEAVHASQDNGRTLILMKKGLTDLAVDTVEELAMIGRESLQDESVVERVALGNNRLTTLPQEFALLSRLRYLNLKSNSFTTFPDVLTLMSSLDTLDISHNKIKRLPSDPGQLVNLRVFCFSRNKVARLPRYLSKFHKLSVLELERNPIEWPPKSVMERPAKFASSEAMKAWIRNIQNWMDADALRSPPRSINGSRYSDLESNLEDSFNSWSRLTLSENEFDEGVTPHARSFSIDSNFSVSSVAESDLETPSSSYDHLERPPPLHLGMLQSSYSTDTSPTHSMESYLPSPADSETFFDTTTDSSEASLQQQHARNASYAHGTARTTNAAVLPGKKSLPDLRTVKLNFTKKVPDLPERGTTKVNRTVDEYSMPSPLSQRQDSGSSASSMTRPPHKYFTKEPAPIQATSAHQSPTRPVPSMAFERNSYFRRLSTLPTSTISTLPEPLLYLIDSARSLLFAVCQIYQTIEHYTIHSIDERLSSVLRKVLDPASADMMQLINSLDRFDAMSRKMLPPPPVCRAVVEGCKDTAAAFAKTVSVLALQIKVIAAGDDVRYLRSMLLMLYGASAEITSAWQKMIPQIDAIKPLLHAKPYPAPSPTGMLTSMNSAEPPASATFSGTPFQLEQPPPLTSLRNTANRTHTARRHAGSFSSKDVELGKKMPSEPASFSRVVVHAPKLRRHATNTSVTIPASPVPLSMSVSSGTESSLANHSRSGSQVSLQASSSSSSPSVPQKSSFLELPSTSKVQVDKEALHAVQEAVEVAPVVWSMMEDMLGHVLDSKPNIRETLERARSVTKRLSDTLRSMQDGDPIFDRSALRQDAHIFLKAVVQLSNVIKKHGGAHSSALRNNMVKLTNSTEEFAILLHVSSFSPASTPRPYSPMYSMSGSQSQVNLLGPPTPEETKLPSSLSRSRSAQAGSTIRVTPVPATPDAPRSALPSSQSFKLPTIRRLRVDGNEPG